MKNLRFLFVFALFLFIFTGKNNQPQEFIQKQNSKTSFFEKLSDKLEAIYIAKQEIKTAVSKTSNYLPSFTHQYSNLYTKQNTPSICFLRLPILSSKHHPPTV